MSDFLSFAARKTIWFILTMLGASLVIFALAGAETSAEQGGLDYLAWLRGALRLDLGVSTAVRPGMAVIELMLWPLCTSMAVVCGGLAISFVLALAGALLRLKARRGPAAALVRHGVTLVSAAPVFLLGYLAVAFINPMIGLLDDAGLIDDPGMHLLGMGTGLFQYVVAAVIIGIGDGMLANLSRSVEGDLKTELGQDYMVSARVNGYGLLSNLGVNLVVPWTTALCARIPVLLGGVIVIEILLSQSGAGRLFWMAALRRDLPLLAGLTLALTLVVGLIQLFRDLVTRLVDPRGVAEEQHVPPGQRLFLTRRGTR